MPKQRSAEHIRIDLPRFREALQRRTTSLPDATYWRYSVGLLPPTLQALLEDPDVLQALADDARSLKEQRNAA